MLKKLLMGILILLTFTVFAFAQGDEPTPTPTPGRSASEEQRAQLEEQVKLLKAQQDYEKAKSELANQRLNDIKSSLPRDASLKPPPEGKTTFAEPKEASPDSAALSYQALKELSTQIDAVMRPATSQYAGIVIYNEPDFFGLAKYRVYRNQSESALTKYRDWRKKLEDFAAPTSAGGPVAMAGANTRMFDLLRTAVSFPGLATNFAGSVGELLSLFRTETTIYESHVTVDDVSLGTAMANELKKGNPSLKILFPAAFVPEYDLEVEGKESILLRISEINMAYADVSEFLSRCNEIPEADRNKPPLRDIIAEAENVKAQLMWLAVAREKVGGQSNRSADDTAEPKASFSDLRQLVRAEKLDRFMRQGSPSLGSATGPRVGILKLRSLASGGSRRETRNLFLGNKISYSGSVTLEVLLFDVDGTLRQSEIFSLHTGFRKLKTNEK